MGARKRLGERAAANRYHELVDGRNLTGSQLLALRVASRIFTHFVNQSAILFEKGEMRKEDEGPKAMLKSLLDYSDAYLRLVRYAFEDAEGDTLTDLFGRKEGEHS